MALILLTALYCAQVDEIHQKTPFFHIMGFFGGCSVCGVWIDFIHHFSHEHTLNSLKTLKAPQTPKHENLFQSQQFVRQFFFFLQYAARGGRESRTASYKTKHNKLPFSLTQCQTEHEVGTAGRSWPSTWTWASTAERRPNARHAGPFLLLSFIAIASSICVAFIVACRSRSTSAAGLLTRVQGAVLDRLCNNAPP